MAPELIAPPVGEAVPEGVPELSLNEASEVPIVEPSAGASAPDAPGVGSNFLLAFFSGAMNSFFAPERQAAQQQGGSVASLVTQGVVITAAWLVAQSPPCRGVAGAIGSALQRVPLVGQGWIGGTVQMIFGAQLGEYAGRKLGQLRKTASSGVGEDRDMFDIYLSDMCVLCHEAFGNGANRVAALDCGHACLCYDCVSWKQPCTAFLGLWQVDGNARQQGLKIVGK